MEQLTSIFKILSDESRIRIIVLLADQELCVCALCQILEISQPNVSKSLAKLKELNLVKSERREKFILYQLKTENAIFIQFINDILENIENYPQLTNDKKRSHDIKQLSSRCCKDGKMKIKGN